MLTTVSDAPFTSRRRANIDGIAGGTMGADHPVTWCKDYQGGRSFYTGARRHRPRASSNANLGDGARRRGRLGRRQSDPVYSDCGATVLANYQQTKISAPPNLQRADRLRPVPGRAGRSRPTAAAASACTTRRPDTTHDFDSPRSRVYTNSEDGLYGPAVDNNFATNHWVYLYYAPQTVKDVKLSDGSIVTQTTPSTTDADPNDRARSHPSAWDPWVGYFQLSRFKFVDARPARRRTSTSRPSSRS